MAVRAQTTAREEAQRHGAAAVALGADNDTLRRRAQR
jgi:hypothetical protein